MLWYDKYMPVRFIISFEAFVKYLNLLHSNFNWENFFMAAKQYFKQVLGSKWHFIDC